MIHYTDEYSDIPIPSSPRQMEGLPETLKELRALSREGNYGAEKLFYEQAKVAENYEDDSVFDGEYIWYNPTYERMNNRVLRGYFGWRTRLRAGRADPTAPVSFAYVLAYELIDGIGEQGKAGLDRLMQLRDMFGERSAAFRKSLDYWIHDFIIYNNLPMSLAPELFQESDHAKASRVLEAVADGADSDPDEFLTACGQAVGKKSVSSAFARKNPEDFARVLMKAFRLADEREKKLGRQGMTDRSLGQRVRIPWYPFRSAIFYDYRNYSEYRYEVAPDQVYECRGGNWTRQARTLLSSRPYPALGELCQETDRQMRQAWHFGHPLKKGTGVYFEEPVSEALAWYRHELEEAAKPKISIDMDSLNQIRKDADKIRDALLVDEETAAPEMTAAVDDTGYEAPGPPEVRPEAETEEKAQEVFSSAETGAGASESESGSVSGSEESLLSEDEREILKRIAEGGDWKGYASEHRLMLSMTVDSINEKLMDEIGDTVLEWDGETPAVIEDYREDIRKFYEKQT
ncbi:MAG: TerB N-terminal domain-containing protein [Lachnospiraceae bacterium]|jgi:hypothetical protein